MIKARDITGERFERLIAIKFEYKIKRQHYWLFKCDCGKEKIIQKASVLFGTSKSCGCLQKEMTYNEETKHKIGLANTTHGLRGNPIYSLWHSMKQRCYYCKSISYKNYGARGIKICSEWKDSFIDFYNWCIKNGYKKGLTIDRINVNGNYCPSNCKFSTNSEQQNNKRNSHFLIYQGEKKTIKEWSKDKRCLVNPTTFEKRIHSYGWDARQAMETFNLRNKK